VAAGALLSLVAANVVLFQKSARLENEVNRLRQVTTSEIGTLKETANVNAQNTLKSFEELTSQVQTAASSAEKLAASATREARASADRAARRTEQLVSNLAAEHKTSQAQLAEAVGAVKQVAEASQTKVGEAFTEIGNVKTEVASTKSALDATIADLKSVRGDLGVQSGLIATNAKELDALKQLGERNYHEFNIAKTNGAVRVGGVALSLRKADLKRNKFNLEVVADDKRVEKKDKTINEPVQFYVASSRLPYEIVVNQIQKDRIIGYLATPKVIQARR
jgi:hypothetical protein